MSIIKRGDKVTHRTGKWGSDYEIVLRVDSINFPEDPMVFFVAGGFWRSSFLDLAINPSLDNLPFAVTLEGDK